MNWFRTIIKEKESNEWKRQNEAADTLFDSICINSKNSLFVFAQFASPVYTLFLSFYA